MKQTRLQKLELLRKALVTTTKLLFPEYDHRDTEVSLNLHSGYSLSDEAKEAEFRLVDNGNGTFWYNNEDDHGNITIFYRSYDVKEN